MLENILKTLGLDSDDTRTYNYLLKNGPTTAGVLSKTMGTPRSSLYGFLKRLKDKNLVTESIKNGVKIFSAESPEKIDLLFKQKQEALAKDHEKYQNLLPELIKNNSANLISPKIQIFEGSLDLQNALKDMLLYYRTETFALWPIKAMLDMLSPDFFRYLNKQRIKNNLQTKAIWPKSQTVDIKKHPYLGVGEDFKREIRVAPKNLDFSMGYWAYGNRVVFISSRKESFGFIIESAELVEMLKSQFELLWNVSEKLEVNPADTKLFVEELNRYA
jgi:sugar-specific transcriptional regulator TrmB